MRMSATAALLVLATVTAAVSAAPQEVAASQGVPGGTTRAAVEQPVPRAVVDRYHLDTRWYAKYVRGPVDATTGRSIAVLGSAAIADSTLLKAARQLTALVRTLPYYPVNELDRRDVRVVLTAHGEKMSSIPEVRAAYGTSLDARYWAGMGATDSLPISVGTEANLVDNQGAENCYVHEFGHTVADMALRHIDPAFTRDLRAAYDRARSAGLWNNTYAGSNSSEYWAEGVQSYFDLNREGPRGGDGVHNDINTRAELARYDTGLHALLDRVYRGAVMPG